MEDKAKELGIAFTTEKNTVHDKPLVFTSWRSDIDHINAGSDIVALTSFNEGTPVSLIEAQSAGKPVVSTRVGGIEDVVRDEETGLLSDISDSESFCKNLLRLVEDKNLRCKLGSAGQGYVTSRYSYPRLVTDMSALYNELLRLKK